MPITLPAELEAFVAAEVASGRYPSADAVLQAAAAALTTNRRRDEARERKLEELRREIDIGIQAVAEGRVVKDFDAVKLLEQLQAQAISSERAAPLEQAG